MLTLERWLGGSPLAVLLKLVFLCLVIGIVMSALGLTPGNVVGRLVEAVHAVASLGFGAVRDFGRYIVTGAIIVIPLWLLSRILSARR